MISSLYLFEFKFVNKHTHTLKYIQMCIICNAFIDMHVYTHTCVCSNECVCACVQMCAHTHTFPGDSHCKILENIDMQKRG